MIKSKNYKILIGILIGILLPSVIAYAVTLYEGNEISYDNSNSNLSSTNVQDAIDELYGMCGNTNSTGTLATTYIQNLYNDGSTINTVNIGGSTSNPTVSLNATQGIMLDNNGEYRYYGADPNNYVIFNDELWRIIGVFSVEDENGNTEQRLKIIRNESIGNYSYDSSDSSVNSGMGVNDWSKSDLMTELNTLYYNRQSGTCYNDYRNSSTTCDFTSIGLNDTAKSMIGQAKFYLGGSSGTNKYANDYYIFERGTTVSDCSADSCGGVRSTEWTGYVGIMYPSDYMYATDLSQCTSESYGSSTCYGNDWLYISSTTQWTISPYDYYYDAILVMSRGSLDGVGDVFQVAEAYGVRPTVYLRSDVAIVSGGGIVTNPFIFG